MNKYFAISWANDLISATLLYLPQNLEFLIKKLIFNFLKSSNKINCIALFLNKLNKFFFDEIKMLIFFIFILSFLKFQLYSLKPVKIIKIDEAKIVKDLLEINIDGENDKFLRIGQVIWDWVCKR